jgi:hypothetical protein
MKTYLLRTLSLFFVLASHSANAAPQLTWDQPTAADKKTGEFILSMPQVGPYNLANTQDSLNAFCNQIAEKAKRSLGILAVQRDYLGMANEKSGPHSAGAFKGNNWEMVSNTEIVTQILCLPADGDPFIKM